MNEVLKKSRVEKKTEEKRCGKKIKIKIAFNCSKRMSFQKLKVGPEKRRRELQGTESYGDESLNVCLSKYNEELEGNLSTFLASVPVHYDYFSKQLAVTRALNPRHSQRTPGSAPSPLKVPLSPSTPFSQVFPENSIVLDNLLLLKAAAYDLMVSFDGIQDWIMSRVPELKDEDNAGVEVQETVIQQVQQFQRAVKGVYMEEMEYLKARGEMESSALKHPDTVSWRRAIALLDQEAWDDMELSWRVLLRTIMLCHAILMKNMQKLKEPRQSRAMHI